VVSPTRGFVFVDCNWTAATPLLLPPPQAASAARSPTSTFDEWRMVFIAFSPGGFRPGQNRLPNFRCRAFEKC